MQDSPALMQFWRISCAICADNRIELVAAERFLAEKEKKEKMPQPKFVG